MGTDVTVLTRPAKLPFAAQIARGLFQRWESALSRFRKDSELCRLNHSCGEDTTVSPLLYSVVRTALAAAEATDGDFDPSMLSSLQRLGYDRTFAQVAPSGPPLPEPPVPGGSWHNIRVHDIRRSILLPDGCALDLGGIAKGMAVDAALAEFARAGIDQAVVNAGGDLAVHGLPPQAPAWGIGLEHLPGRVVSLVNGAVATSGLQRRQWQRGALRLHHLLDPRTGLSSDQGLAAVTVVAATCTEAEVAAKVAFVRGPQDGRRFLEDHGLSGLFLHADGRLSACAAWPNMEEGR